MHRRRVARRSSVAVVTCSLAVAGGIGVCSLAVIGCSGESEPRKGLPPLTTTTASGGQGGEVTTGGQGAGAGGAGAAGGGGAAAAGGGGGGGGATGCGGAGTGGLGGAGGEGGLMFGSIPLVEEPDTACEATAAAPSVIYSGGISPPGLDRLALMGGRFLAYDASFSTGYVTFDLDGSNPTTPSIAISDSFNMASSEGATVGLAAADSSQLFFSRYDANDVPAVGPLIVANEVPDGVAIGGGGGESVVLWGVGTDVRARGVNAAGAFAGAAFDLGPGTVDGLFWGTVAYDETSFAAAWTSIVGGQYVTSFAKLGTTAAVGNTITLVATSIPHWIEKIEWYPGVGYALVFSANLPPWRPIVVIVDEDGAVLGSGHVLLGANAVFDMAVRGSDAGIVAQRDTNETQFRSVDLTGTPLGPWVCLNGTENSLSKMAAVAASGDSYFILYRQPDHSEVLIETDRFGSIAR